MTRTQQTQTAASTEGLIDQLAGQAGLGRMPGPGRFRAILATAAVASLGLSAALVLALEGTRPDFATAVYRAPFAFKIASMLALSLAGLLLASRAALPGSRRLTAMAFVPAALTLAFRAATDQSGLSTWGNSDISAGGCVLTILAASLPPLIIVFGVMRMGAVTRPTVAGAIAGALSGSLGAAAYALACRNDAGLFVAIWYSLAILVMAAAGAAIGRRTLIW